MKIRFIQLGRTQETWAQDACTTYKNRLKHYCSLLDEEVDVPSRKGRTSGDQMEAEARKVVSLLKERDWLVLLDERGEEFSSLQFASWIGNKLNSLQGDLVFVSGGAFGFHETLTKVAKEKISLSRMTFTHQMARLFFLEQVYRAFTILRNESYHHE